MKTLRTLGLVVACLLAACDGYFHAPAEGAARVGVAFRQVAGGENAAFDVADNVAVEVRVGATTLHSEVVPVTPGGTAAMAEVVVDLPEGATGASVAVDLRTGTQPLFTGSSTVTLTPGQVSEVVVDLEPVVASLDVVAPAPFTTFGNTTLLEGRALFASGHEVPGVTIQWESLAPGIVTVEAEGAGWRATAVSEGSAMLRAAGGGAEATVNAEVAVVAASLEVVPDSLHLRIGETGLLTAIARDSSETPIPGRVPEWVSSDPAVAEVDADGEVMAVAPGSATIEANVANLRAAARVRVIPPGPSVTTLEPTQVTATTAVFQVDVHTHGEPTTLYFVHGTTPDLRDGRSTDPISLQPSASPRVIGQPVTGLPSGTRIYYRAVASHATETRMGEIVSFETLALPGTPMGLTASLSNGVLLQWTSGSGDELRFEIERDVVPVPADVGPNPSGPAAVFQVIGTTGPGVTEFRDPSPPAGELHYRVRACHANGCSPWSDPLVWFYGLPPSVVTTPPLVLSNGRARLQLEVNPHDAPTVVYWQIGFNEEFSEWTYYPADDGFDPVPLDAGAGHLPVSRFYITPDWVTGYWVRAVAENTWGTTYGNILLIEGDQG